ncbi:hypothetical protein X293_01935 [Oenococcus oeni IOEB_C52]|nr:hypothetical protein X293_01935 [Oenococcus oeni IOEB_C52]
MSSIRYAFLSLLAREPLSGYDIKQQMNGRVNFFYKVNNNQLYPVLAKLKDEGLIQVQSYEKETSRPARKVYQITEEGISILKAWVVSPEKDATWDDFMLKQYDSWLMEPQVMCKLLENKQQEHQKRLGEYKSKIAEFRDKYKTIRNYHPLFSTIAVLEMGVRLEQAYIQWCSHMLDSYKIDEI